MDHEGCKGDGGGGVQPEFRRKVEELFGIRAISPSCVCWSFILDPSCDSAPERAWYKEIGKRR